MNCKHANSGCNYPEAECGGQCMTTEHDKAVALAEDHGLVIMGLSSRPEVAAQLAAMLADHRQQIIEELAQRSGVMPKPAHLGWCRAHEVREAIASLEAKVEHAAYPYKSMLAASQESLKQSEARVRELESRLKEIGDFAHDRSTGPAVPDALWEVRAMAYELT
jgi:hypothetical protein